LRDLVTTAAPTRFVLQLSLDPKFGSYMESTLQMATSQGLIGPVKSLMAKSPLTLARTTISMSIPDDDVGAILGKGGQSLLRMQQVSQ
jgi:RNA-binding protein Nova